MKRNALIIGVILSSLVSACGAQAAPTVNPVDVQHTAEAAAFTMVAETQQALPTATPIPPTETPSPTLPATNTPLPSLTPSTLVASLTGVPSQPNIPTLTPQASTSGESTCNKLLTSWDGPTARINVTDESTPAGAFVIISFTVTTPLGECGYIGTSFTGSGSLSGPYGTYTAVASVNGKKNFIVATNETFKIKQGSVSIVITNNRLVLRGACESC